MPEETTNADGQEEARFPGTIEIDLGVDYSRDANDMDPERLYGFDGINMQVTTIGRGTTPDWQPIGRGYNDSVVSNRRPYMREGEQAEQRTSLAAQMWGLAQHDHTTYTIGYDGTIRSVTTYNGDVGADLRRVPWSLGEPFNPQNLIALQLEQNFPAPYGDWATVEEELNTGSMPVYFPRSTCRRGFKRPIDVASEL